MRKLLILVCLMAIAQPISAANEYSIDPKEVLAIDSPTKCDGIGRVLDPGWTDKNLAYRSAQVAACGSNMTLWMDCWEIEGSFSASIRCDATFQIKEGSLIIEPHRAFTLFASRSLEIGASSNLRWANLQGQQTMRVEAGNALFGYFVFNSVTEMEYPSLIRYWDMSTGEPLFLLIDSLMSCDVRGLDCSSAEATSE